MTIGLAAAPAAAGSGTAGAARNCAVPRYPGSGYFTSLKVTRVDCATGKRVMLAHYRCRSRHGRSGRCSAAAGYRCSERRTTIATEFDAIVTCRRGPRKVVYSYQQNT